MMNIAFCNFPKSYQNNKAEDLNLEVRQYLIKKHNSVVCKCYDTISDVKAPYDFYFSYISKPQDVIDINSIRKKFLFGDIILVAESLEFALLGFEYLCFGYLIFPIQIDNLYRILDNICEKNTREIISVHTTEGLRRVTVQDILYVNIEGRAICYHMENGENVYTHALRKSFKKTVNKELLVNDTFLFLEPALVINVDKLATIYKDDRIEFDNGTTYPISKEQRVLLTKLLG